MGRRGPRPEPLELRELKGNPGNRKLPRQGPEPERAPKGWAPPDHLHGEARREWFRLVKLLQPLRVLAVTDKMALATCCLIWGRIVESELHLRRTGKVLTTTNGNLVHNPWLSINKQAMELHVRYLAMFGLSPTDRARLAMAQPHEPPTPATAEAENETPEAEALGAETPFAGLLGKQSQTH